MRIAVVGGGLFGSCTAYELAKAGCRVTLVDRDPVGSHASGRNPGNLNPILATPAPLRAFAMASFKRHEALQQELLRLGSRDYAFEPVKRVLLCLDGQDRRELEETALEFAGPSGFSAHWLEGQALRALETRLAPQIGSGLLIEGNRSLDSRAFNHALLDGAGKLGATCLRADVLEVRHRTGTGHVLRTDGADIECDILVLAAGPWVAETKTWFGVELPVEPVKGEMLRLRLPGANITHDFTHGMISLYRRGKDEVWVGVTRESCGFDERPTAAARELLLHEASRIMPAIVEAGLLEHQASLRPMSRTGLPIVGNLPGRKDVFVVNGGGAKGVLLSAGIARALADVILSGRTELPINEFSP